MGPCGFLFALPSGNPEIIINDRKTFERWNHLSIHIRNFRGGSSQMMVLTREQFLKPDVLNWIRISTCVDSVFCIIASAWAVRSQGSPTSCVLQRPSEITLNYKLLWLFIHVLWPCMAFFFSKMNKRTASQIESFTNRMRLQLLNTSCAHEQWPPTEPSRMNNRPITD